MKNQSEKIIALLGPTNTGKTHVAIEKINSSIFKSYFFPKFNLQKE